MIRFASRFLPYGFPVPIVAGPLVGARWYAGYNPGPGRGLSVCLNRYEAASLAAAVDLSRGCRCALDIGAHSGLYSLLFARLSPEVYAFEPLPENMVRLCHTVAGNRLSERIRVIPAAVGGEVGLSGFSPGPETSMGSLQATGAQPVVVVTLDAFCKQFSLRPEVIKIDVEGAESEVLTGGKGILGTLHPKLLLSTHSEALKQTCLRQLAELGYRRVRLLGTDTIVAEG